MATKTLLAAVSAASAAAGTAQLLDVSPFLEGQNARGVIALSPDAAGSVVVKIQSSPDNTTWTDVLTLTGVGNPTLEGEVTCDKYMRGNVTGAGSAGKVSVYLNGLT